MEKMKYCTYCGASLPMQAMFCRKCGKPYEEKKSETVTEIKKTDIPVESVAVAANVNAGQETTINKPCGEKITATAKQGKHRDIILTSAGPVDDCGRKYNIAYVVLGVAGFIVGICAGGKFAGAVVLALFGLLLGWIFKDIIAYNVLHAMRGWTFHRDTQIPNEALMNAMVTRLSPLGMAVERNTKGLPVITYRRVIYDVIYNDDGTFTVWWRKSLVGALLLVDCVGLYRKVSAGMGIIAYNIQQACSSENREAKEEEKVEEKVEEKAVSDNSTNTTTSIPDSAESSNIEEPEKKKKFKWWLIALIAVVVIVIIILAISGSSNSNAVLSDHLGDSHEGVESVIKTLGLKESTDNVYESEGLTLAVNDKGNISELCIASPDYPFYDIKVGDTFDVFKDGSKLTSQGYNFISDAGNEIVYGMDGVTNRRIVLVMDNGVVIEIDYFSLGSDVSDVGQSFDDTDENNSASLNEENIQILTDRGQYYGYNTAWANIIATVLDNYDIENLTIIDKGLQYIDEHAECFPAKDPGFDYYNTVDFGIQQRTIAKYPGDEYGLMHVAGCISDIEYTENDEETRKLTDSNGFTEFTLYGYCDNSNSNEAFHVLYNGDIPFAYSGSSVVVIGTPVAMFNDGTVLLVASMVMSCDSNLDGKIVYGKTESEEAMDFAFGSWATLYMSQDKIKEETVRLGKEKSGFSEDSTDDDIPVSMFIGSWISADSGTNRTHILVSMFDQKLEDFEVLLENEGEGYREIFEKYKSMEGKYEYVVTVDQVDYFGNLEGKSIVFSNDTGSGTITMSFNKAAWPIQTLAKDWLSDKTQSKNGVYLHYSSSENTAAATSDDDYEGTWYSKYGYSITIEKNGNQYIYKSDYEEIPCELQDGVLKFDGGTFSLSDEPIQTELATPYAKEWTGDEDNRVSTNGQYLIMCYSEDDTY